MPETTKTVITDALQLLVIQASEAPIEAEEARTAIRILNNMMASLTVLGVNIGYTQVSQLDDILTVPDSALYPIKAMLAQKIAPEYMTGLPSPLVLAEAKEGKKLLIMMGSSIAASEYPSTLPTGSGNHEWIGDRKFYPDLQGTILSETNGSISLEDDTE